MSNPAWSRTTALPSCVLAAPVSFTVISMSLSLIAVFLPILLMPGIIGLLFHEFAVMTLSIAILISLVIFARRHADHGGGLSAEARRRPALQGALGALVGPGSSNGSKNACVRGSLTIVLDHTLMVGLTFVGLIVLNVFLLRLVPSTFFPELET